MPHDGPVIPVAILRTTAGRREVSPASDDWWNKLEEMREASRRRELFCPDCEQLLDFIAKNVQTPHFKHHRDLQGCVDAVRRDPERARVRSQRWARQLLVSGLHQLLPTARPECDPFLAARSRAIPIDLHGRQVARLLVIASPTRPHDLRAEQAQAAAARVPLITLFAGDRVPGGIRAASPGRVQIAGLDGDHLAAATPHLLDPCSWWQAHGQFNGTQRMSISRLIMAGHMHQPVGVHGSIRAPCAATGASAERSS